MEVFLTLADFSIALAGFTSVVIVFVQQGERWRDVDAFRIRNALFLSIASAFLSFFPFLFQLLHFSEKNIWANCSYLFIMAVFTFWVIQINRYKKLSIEDKELIPMKVIIMVSTVLFTAIILQIVNVLIYCEPGLYMLSILLLLFLSFFAFVRSIFYRPKS